MKGLIKIMKYIRNKFIEYITEDSISFRNKVLIIDEIQNLISEKGVYYKILHHAIKEAPSSLRIVLLSATPMFDKPIEIALTMNLLNYRLKYLKVINFLKSL